MVILFLTAYVFSFSIWENFNLRIEILSISTANHRNQISKDLFEDRLPELRGPVPVRFKNRCHNSNRNRNRKLKISTAPTKVKSPQPAYSQSLIQNKIDRQRVRSRKLDRQTVYGGWCLELRRGGRDGEEHESEENLSKRIVGQAEFTSGVNLV